jgi:uncharacterized membrane protein YfcA
MIYVLAVLGSLGGFLSGLLGLGGALVMIPLMLTVPPLVGVGELSMRTVAGLSMLQVLFASLSGVIVHGKNSRVHLKTLLLVGVPMGVFSLVGAYTSKYIGEEVLLAIFGGLVLIALVILAADRRDDAAREEYADALKVDTIRSLLTGGIVGTLSGMVGAGGGFVLIPVMVSFLGIPLKVTIGTSLGIVLIGALMGSIGKLVSLQVDFGLAVPLIIGSLLFARFGAKLSNVLPARVLRYILIGVVVLSGIQVLIKALC